MENNFDENNSRENIPEEIEDTPINSSLKNKKATRKLFRSRKDRIFFGVCGGLGEYLNINPILFRLVFILSLAFGFWGLVFYLVLSLVMMHPADLEYDELENTYEERNEKPQIIIGAFFFLLGIYLLLIDSGLSRYFNLFGFRHQFIIPVLLTAAGIIAAFRYNIEAEEIEPPLDYYRSDNDKIISGVCSGLANYFNTDPFIIRLIFILLTIITIGVGLAVYILFVISTPERKEN